jgi:hypothetical protein
LREIAHVLSLEIVVITFLAVFQIELGPPATETMLQWSDLQTFAKVLLAVSLMSIVVEGIAAEWHERSAKRRSDLSTPK